MGYKSISKIMPAEVKQWLDSLANQPNFTDLKSDLQYYLDELYDEVFVTRMNTTMCSACGCLGVRVELNDVFNGNQKFICEDCFVKL